MTEELVLIVKKEIRVPATIASYQDFARALTPLQEYAANGKPTKQKKIEFLQSMFYLLGWMVGDGGKDTGSVKLKSVRIKTELSKRHPDNLKLGEFVVGIIERLNVRCTRLPDKRPGKRNPYGAYRWNSYFSPIFGWMFTTCLGLKWNERTTLDPVKMDWLLSAPLEMRYWFLRGLADSDGSVHFRDKCVDITTQPNTEFIARLLNSVGAHTSTTYSRTKNCGTVTISIREAMRIRIFNPVVLTYRRKILEKLANAKTFQRHWPDWLKVKVERLILEGHQPREICETLLEENDTFIKMHTVKRKMRRLRGVQSTLDGTPARKSFQFDPAVPGAP